MEDWKDKFYSLFDQPEIDAHFLFAVTKDGKRCFSVKKLGKDLASSIALVMIEDPDELRTFERMQNVLKKAKEIFAQFLIARGPDKYEPRR